MTRFRNRVFDRRVPLSGTLELTSRCNLRCVHCYIGPQRRQQRVQELTSERWCSIIDEITAAGCLHLTITGGDPMLRQDFCEIYRHARQRGLLVTVFCNGLLVEPHVIETFREYAPVAVEVSLHGATPVSYEKVAGVRGSFQRALSGIRRLLDSGVPVKLKTMLLTLNYHEIGRMRRLATELGVSFRVDGGIFPCLPDHDARPLELRVSPEEVVRQELSDPIRVREWIEHIEGHTPAPSDKLYRCGAGVTSFFIDALGNASPCLMTTHYRFSLAKRSFASLWERELAQLRHLVPRSGYECNDCEMQVACGNCPAFAYLETGHEDVRSDYACRTTQLRWNALQRLRAGGETSLSSCPTPAASGLPAASRDGGIPIGGIAGAGTGEGRRA
jgi:radical SAM protein with 4Fe4S-binding SPASM domain